MDEKVMPDEKQIKLSDQTPVSLKLVMGLLAAFFSVSGALVSVVMWASQVEAKAINANTRLDGVETRAERTITVLSRVDRRLARIEGALHIPIYNAPVDEEDGK